MSVVLHEIAQAKVDRLSPKFGGAGSFTTSFDPYKGEWIVTASWSSTTISVRSEDLGDGVAQVTNILRKLESGYDVIGEAVGPNTDTSRVGPPKNILRSVREEKRTEPEDDVQAQGLKPSLGRKWPRLFQETSD